MKKYLLEDILEKFKFPKSTYMYCQKGLIEKDESIEKQIKTILTISTEECMVILKDWDF